MIREREKERALARPRARLPWRQCAVVKDERDRERWGERESARE